MKRKTSGAISRKNRGPVKSRRTNGSTMEDYAAGRQEVKKLEAKGCAWLAVHFCMAVHLELKVYYRYTRLAAHFLEILRALLRNFACTFARPCIWSRKFIANMHG